MREFAIALSSVNCGRGTWEAGWTVSGLEIDGRVAVTKDGLTLWAEPALFRPKEGVLRTGAAGSLRVPKELRERVQGFYVAIGDAAPSEDRGAPLVRLYWHLTCDAAVQFVESFTGALNTLGVPFRMKVLSDPEAYDRADAGLLCLDRYSYLRVRESIGRVYALLAPRLRPSTPLLTRVIAPGLGLAEDPGNGESFGQNRCGIVARALWSAFLLGRTSSAERIDAVASEFLREGLDPCRPHLARGSSDVYDPASAPEATAMRAEHRADRSRIEPS